jgi:hypothetical protein
MNAVSDWNREVIDGKRINHKPGLTIRRKQLLNISYLIEISLP